MDYNIFFRTFGNKNNANTYANYTFDKKNDIKLDQIKLDEKNIQAIKAKEKNEIYEKKLQERKSEIINSFYFDDFF